MGRRKNWIVDKMRVPVARILTWPWLTSPLHTCGQFDSMKRALPSALGTTRWQGCKAAGEQSRGWSGGSAEKTEAQKMAVRDDFREAGRTAVGDDCAERFRGRLCGQRGPEAETGLLPADSL